MANLAIKGHPTRCKEIIEILEMLGGENKYHISITGGNLLYTIREGDDAIIATYPNSSISQIYTLKEFLEKFPYKVGDKVTHLDYESPLEIVGMKWENDSIKYEVYTNDYGYWFSVDELQPYKEQETKKVSTEFFDKYCKKCGSQRCTAEGEWLEGCKHYKEETTDKANKAVFDANAQCCDIMNHLIMEETIKIDIPKGYEFAGVDDDNQQVVFEKIGCQYPKTYKECFNICFGNKHHIVQVLGLDGLGDNKDLFERFIKLKICRDAYWKIAGEEMGLDKPWKYDMSKDEFVYAIVYQYGYIQKCEVRYKNHILAFPTMEMRDAFYENFKELINDCKELL